MACTFTTDEEVLISALNELGWFVLWRDPLVPEAEVGTIVPVGSITFGEALPQRPFVVLGRMTAEELAAYQAWLKKHEIPLLRDPYTAGHIPYKIGCD